MRPKIEICFWGVRGSIATHLTENSHYGGHTSCISICYKKHWFVCDAGTGIRLLGQKLAQKKVPVTILLSHLHWDHLFGLPFFKPLYEKNRKIMIVGPSTKTFPFRKTLRQIVRSPYFPVTPQYWSSKMRLLGVGEKRLKIGRIVVEAKWVRHTDKALGFQFYFPNGKRIIYVADHNLKASDKQFAKWIRNADVLIHDAQFDKKEYAKKWDWGHSCFETVVEVALNSKIKKLVLFHHDPNASDKILDKRLKFCNKKIRRAKSKLKCCLAKEGFKILI